MKDKISIILPIFNVGDHLRGGIDSLVNQTIGNENLEIIMVNDCSTDGSDKIIDEYDENTMRNTNAARQYTTRKTAVRHTLRETPESMPAQATT